VCDSVLKLSRKFIILWKLIVVGIKDPLRKEVYGAVAQCAKCGITVRMVTGDNPLTAEHIARECGILTDGVYLDGKTFRNMDPIERDKILPRLQVLARSTPTDKFILVNRLRALGEVVAVTGDGKSTCFPSVFGECFPREKSRS
jgi:P-type Ca2+ transporter type 2C